MKKNYTHITFIMDRSGSMEGLETDTIGGFNKFLNDQKQEPGDATLTTVLFDNNFEFLHEWKNLFDISPMTHKEYFVRGSTALLDAMGRTISFVGKKLDSMNEDEKPSKVIVIIITDGMENSSKEFSSEKIKEMVELQKNKYNWEFVFLGANIDAFLVGNSYGITATSNYTATTRGTSVLYKNISKTVAQYRADGTIHENWNQEIE